MKFTLTTTGNFYTDEDQIEKLKGLGFEFIEDSVINDLYEIKEGFQEIEINSLEELIKFTENYGEIILNENEIEIYDDYRE